MIKGKLFTDGGARGNPGPSAIGGVLYSEDKLIDSFSEYLDHGTNNQAEYQALIFGLNIALKNKITELECFLDSELIVNQLNQEYKVKDKILAKLFVKVWNLSQLFKKISFTHIERSKNKEADALVNKALDEYLK
ncbi:MAG: ribonuclease H [Candidatus Komeilibacteria bacterium CG11_big_fil_rev_8_21_14_0_20_36_20]|uniref:Ribonuclease H n=1 Tax=Candidatus Komeilibacteria bacterium CG11_big_fil_rev_8_21_14_0_20_36_20 TaxID=1974477 RepID=A0A2H0NBQ0_9BACT|nr:MAG: ribonuclease H [Candidatus Komeilibacteria bacterium CG11_big_fil_rev_8_21_14_0_20_36_20]PIR81453.1 MAG: ribonuclease H [Candidatus Komeilibacteria bacterium CG10_big_fil_rev_8_21_14_0_10_36_65]PJC55654.1 MAG: ribonuclease H [Candidatus Komeilibacteria bacterium CG_4_9_14_0_2_um_filter_36_13]